MCVWCVYVVYGGYVYVCGECVCVRVCMWGVSVIRNSLNDSQIKCIGSLIKKHPSLREVNFCMYVLHVYMFVRVFRVVCGMYVCDRELQVISWYVRVYWNVCRNAIGDPGARRIAAAIRAKIRYLSSVDIRLLRFCCLLFMMDG